MYKATYLQTVADAIAEEMARDETVFVMGEDIGWNMMGGSGGLLEKFGPERVRNTPISEAGFVGAAAGAAMAGMRPVVDMMIASFTYCAFDQIVSILAKSTYLYGGQATLPVTIRAPMLYNNTMAAQHSDRPLATFMTIPGLKLLAPSNAYDLKGLMKSAIRDDDPVVLFDDGTRWASTEELPDEEYVIPLGEAAVKRVGSDVTVVALAGSVVHAMTAADRLAEEGISVEVVDPRTVVPLDLDTVLGSVAKTGRLVVADPCHRTLSVASEISALVAEHGFWSLEAPVVRVTGPATHIPFSPALEAGLFPNPERIVDGIRAVLA